MNLEKAPEPQKNGIAKTQELSQTGDFTERMSVFALQYVKVLSVREKILAAKRRKKVLSVQSFAPFAPFCGNLVFFGFGCGSPRCALLWLINCRI
ncbi:MAG: hypothetical protein HYY23_16870 [Verrucomicrobia bacterium]|nr:hypothetical protein [Verrucomicrobiota bacterium]